MAPTPSDTATPIIVAKTAKTSTTVPNGPSTLFPKIGRNVREMSPKSFFLNCVYARANATIP